MEANLGSASCGLYVGGGGGRREFIEFNQAGRKPFDWDLNDWNWDGDMLVATPVSVHACEPSNSQSSCSVENGGDLAIVGKGKGVAEKRRRVGEDESGQEGCGTVVAGGTAVANGEEKNGKRSMCQVEGCGAELSSCKDYHKRHKVCVAHSKASTAVVGGKVQRFCQQCSRFHVLEEFDEGKRSCRRRLAGHNKRRRKVPADAGNGAAVINDKAAGYILVTLLKLLSDIHMDNAGQLNQHYLLPQLLKSLIGLAGACDPGELCRLLQSAQIPQINENVPRTSIVVPPVLDPSSSATPPFSASKGAFPIDSLGRQDPVLVADPMACKSKEYNFDLNDTYNADDGTEDWNENSAIPVGRPDGSPSCLPWIPNDSLQNLPHASGNSESSSGPTPSCSNRDALVQFETALQCRTDRIVFKLFGKHPRDLPLILHQQILDWLSNTPTNIESYIKPGCIILTLYLRLHDSDWAELCDDVNSYLLQLLNGSADPFWQSGWICVMLPQHIAFIYDGRVLMDLPAPTKGPHFGEILWACPVAVSHSSTVKFTLKGINLRCPSTRVICCFEGKYLFQEVAESLVEDDLDVDSELVAFSCTLPNSSGRGFIEVERDGYSFGFFPFIVSDADVCTEICALDNALEEGEGSRICAVHFLNELGWLLRQAKLVSEGRGNFDAGRFRWLIAFSMDRDWCAVVRKLLDLLLAGAVDLHGESVGAVLSSENLLHRAVHRNCAAMVTLLMNYRPCEAVMGKVWTGPSPFRPDVPDVSKVTPLHLAAASSGADAVLDALTSDPEMVGLTAWKTVCDLNGQTPESYARASGRGSYLRLIQRKLDSRLLPKASIVIGIPKIATTPGSFNIIIPEEAVTAAASYGQQRPRCRHCNTMVRPLKRQFLQAPMLLSIVAIAAVCVCVGLILQSMPVVRGVTPSFRWELLRSGCI